MKKLLMTIVLAPVMAMALELSPSFTPEAITAYKIMAEAGKAEAQFLYAWALSMGSAPGKHNPAVAFDNAKKSAGQGFELAYRLVGLGFAEGWNGSSNVVEAAAWYGKFFSWAKPAAEKGNAWAQLQLGQCYESGSGIEKDPKEAVKWYRKAAEQGCAIAQSHLALCYAGGVGVERDEKEELNWERKAAEQGVYASQMNLGLLYGNGDIVERDPAEAVKWYRKAAGQGFSQAQCLLGLCYRRGIGVEINHAEAVKWYSKAAKAGYTDASYRLWLYYVNGEGVEKNLTEAASWYCKLAKNEWKPRGDPLKTDELLANLIGEKGLADNMKKVYDSLMALGKELKDCPAEVKAYYEKDLSFAKGRLEQEKIKPLVGVRRARSKSEKTPEPELKEDVNGYTWSYRVSDTWSRRVPKRGATINSASPKLNGDVSIPQTLGCVPVTKIGDGAFKNCEKLTSVTFSPSVEEIGWYAFVGCSSLTAVSIPAGVRWIFPGAFSGCKSLTAIMVSEENEQYVSKDGIVFGKEMKTLVCYPGGISGGYVVPSGVKKIHSNAFQGCSGLTSIVISDSVREIEGFAFCRCEGLVSMKIGSGVTDIEPGVFYQCGGLTSISVDPANTRYASQDGVLFDKGIKTVICCPGGLSGEYAIPSNVTSIGRCAFEVCRKLTAVTIPESVTSIGDGAFRGCSSLTSVRIRGERPNSPDNVFGRCTNLKEIHVPSNAKSWAGMKEWQGIPLVFDGVKADEKIERDKSTQGKSIVAEKLQGCDFLLNKNFKKNAKFYLCLFSASWCPPCRREMPRIAKTYAETLRDDPDIELIHFSRDQNDEKALAWAKEHDVKFPVVKPKGGNPLDLHCNGIPHLFIVKDDGTLLEEGHPMRLFTDEKIRALKDR